MSAFFVTFNQLDVISLGDQFTRRFKSYLAASQNHHISYFFIFSSCKCHNLIDSMFIGCEINLVPHFKKGIATRYERILCSITLQGDGHVIQVWIRSEEHTSEL